MSDNGVYWDAPSTGAESLTALMSRIHNGRCRRVSSPEPDKGAAPERFSVLGVDIAGDVRYRPFPTFLALRRSQMLVVVWTRPSLTAAWSAA